MKKLFSNSWIGSKQVRKQRKYRFEAPLHLSHHLVSATLSKELRKKYARRSIPLRKGDKVKIMRGSFFDKEGKVSSVDLKRKRIMIEGIQRTKKDGSKISVVFDPSNLMIKELALEDKERVKSLEKIPGKKTEIQEKKPRKEKKNAP